MTVGRNPYRGPAPLEAPEPTPASGMPPSRFPGPPAASGAALTVLTSCGATWPVGPTFPVHETGTDSLPIEPALPIAAAGWAAPPPSSPPRLGRPLGTAGAAAAAGAVSAPVVLAIWTKLLPIPMLKYGRPSVL